MINRLNVLFAVLWKLRDGNIHSIAKEEDALITASIEKEMKSVQGGACQVLTDRRFFRSFACVIVLNAGQQLVGINAVRLR